MQERYADVIIDISHEAVDRPFQYRIPQELADRVRPGCQVDIPFGRGNSLRKGYVIGISEQSECDDDRLKSIAGVSDGAVAVPGRLLALAAWIKENYGSTMINAIQTVLPVRRTVRQQASRTVVLREDADPDKLEYAYMKKNASAKLRLLRALESVRGLSMRQVTNDLKIGRQTIYAMESEGVIRIEADGREESGGVQDTGRTLTCAELSCEQKKLVDEFERDYDSNITRTYLLRGVTGSGKTEVYVRCIRKVVASGRQAIMLIPEIALTYQTVSYFKRYFGDRVAVINSRLSGSEKYDCFERAENGEVDVVIGPRSALFTPFENLGLIIMDEEHESSYKSDSPPKYHAREVAIKRAEMERASVILGSATPSVESYAKASDGTYRLWTMNERVQGGRLAKTSIVDLREELRRGNRSVISDELSADIADRLEKKEQIMLFVNRRGFNSCVSCRSCGEVIRCPHCDVALTKHMGGETGGKLLCHYCGYAAPSPRLCPSCGSRYIGGYGVGTEKVEQEIKRLFPEASVLRMDRDTTSHKNSYRDILTSFAKGEADILVGTQMIVKGHDFENVTLVGIILADLTLFSGDYRAGERTFDLLTQAAGRAGRGEKEGKVVIQTYKPDNYAILAAAEQDYDAFYQTESAYRSFMRYPPEWNMLVVMATGVDEEQLVNLTDRLYSLIREKYGGTKRLSVIGPAEPAIERIRDLHRRVLYIKHEDYSVLVGIKDMLEGELSAEGDGGMSVFFDFNPVNAY